MKGIFKILFLGLVTIFITGGVLSGIVSPVLQGYVDRGNIEYEKTLDAQKEVNQTQTSVAISNKPQSTIGISVSEPSLINSPNTPTGKLLSSVASVTIDIIITPEVTPSSIQQMTIVEHTPIPTLNITELQKIAEFSGHADDVGDLAISPNGQYLGTASLDNSYQLWNLEDGNVIATKQSTQDGFTVDFSTDSRLFASSGADGIVTVWNTETGQIIRSFEGHTSAVFDLAFCPNDHMLASASDDSTIRLWLIDTDESIVLEGHTAGVKSIAFSPDGRYLVSGALDNTILLWDLSLKKSIATYKGHTRPPRLVKFSPDGNFFVSSSWDRTVRIWSTNTQEPIHVFESDAYGVQTFDISPDSSKIIAGSINGEINAWDVASGENLYASNDNTGDVMAIDYSPSGKLFVSGAFDNTVRVFNASTGEQLIMFNHDNDVLDVEFSPDGSVIISSDGNGDVFAWGIAKNPVSTYDLTATLLAETSIPKNTPTLAITNTP